MERSLRSAIQVPPAMIIVWAIAIYRRASLPRLIAMQRRVLAETMIKANVPFKERVHAIQPGVHSAQYTNAIASYTGYAGC